MVQDQGHRAVVQRGRAGVVAAGERVQRHDPREPARRRVPAAHPAAGHPQPVAGWRPAVLYRVCADQGDGWWGRESGPEGGDSGGV